MMNFHNEKMNPLSVQARKRRQPHFFSHPALLPRSLASLSISGVQASFGIIVVPVFPVFLCVCVITHSHHCAQALPHSAALSSSSASLHGSASSASETPAVMRPLAQPPRCLVVLCVYQQETLNAHVQRTKKVFIIHDVVGTCPSASGQARTFPSVVRQSSSLLTAAASGGAQWVTRARQPVFTHQGVVNLEGNRPFASTSAWIQMKTRETTANLTTHPD